MNAKASLAPPRNRRLAPRGTPGPTGPDWPLAGGLAVGVLLDALAGDPARGHPVALFGRVMLVLERHVYADRALRGTGYAAAGTAVAVGTVQAAARLTRGGPEGRAAVTALTCWAVLGARSLSAAAAAIGAALAGGDLPRAQELLPQLCGRDPADLDGIAITRAVIESVAENTSDAVVAPLLWGALAGPGGLSGYRAVNTLDAMVGHHSPRYERFGRASARLDDVANWAPARVTALLTAACSPAVHGGPARTWSTARDYGPRHPSPNAGWCEAAFAGALGIRLGGALSYAGRAEHRPELGTGRPPQPGDISRAIRLSRAVTATASLLAATLAAAAGTQRADRPSARG